MGLILQARTYCLDIASNIIESAALDKTYNKTYVTRKDLDQHVNPPTTARVLVYPSLDSPEAVEGTCDQQRLWSDCADAQADLSLRCSHKSCCRISRALANMFDKVQLMLLEFGQQQPFSCALSYFITLSSSSHTYMQNVSMITVMKSVFMYYKQAFISSLILAYATQ